MTGKKDIIAEKKGFWNVIDNIKGDKVIWMIVIMLIMFSIITIFSSTTLLVRDDVSRLDIFREQMYVVAGGLFIIIFCCWIPYIAVFRWISQFGFIISALLLACLVLGIGSEEINGAVRTLRIAGVQVHVYEIVKVLMVMYLSWATHALKNDSFAIADRLSSRYRLFRWMKSRTAKIWIYIFLPILFVLGCILKGSVSSSLFIGLIMFITTMVGGVNFKHILTLGAVCIMFLGLAIGAYFISGGNFFPRIGTAMNRLTLQDDRKVIEDLKPGTIEFQEVLDKIKQPESAKLAIKEGGILGKGPGQSTQKYVVPLIFSDYMFSFIIEEYGLLGGILIVILYTSLLARGSLIVRSCENQFAKTAVAGLTVLITGQAMMHMFINADIGLLTGQTLPLVSHGKSSFLAFSVAFGIILSISKMAKENIEKESDNAEPIIGPEDLNESLNDLDYFESEYETNTAENRKNQ